MYIKIRDYNDPDTWHTYTKLVSLTFAPEVDFPSSTIPANEFVAEIVTTDEIPTMQEARLYDNMDALWAAYYVTEANRTSRKTVRVVAQSALALMDKWTWGAEMIQNMTVSDFVLKLFGRASGSQTIVLPKSGTIYPFLADAIEVDSGLASDTITGFFPEQTARERLHWLCLNLFAFVLQFTRERMKIAQWDVSSIMPLIPLSATYSKPRYIHNQPVNALYVRYAENFTLTDMSGSDGYASSEDDEGTKWWYRKGEAIKGDRDADGQGIVFADTTMDMGLSGRMNWLLQSDRIEVEVVNNGQYWPGQQVKVYLDEQTIYRGLIMSCDFSFGLQSKSKLVVHLRDATPLTAYLLAINYGYTDPATGQIIHLGRKRLYLPEGEYYAIPNPTIMMDEKVYSPPTPITDGVITEDTTINVAYITDDDAPETVVAYIDSINTDSGFEVLNCDEAGADYISAAHPVSAVTNGKLTNAEGVIPRSTITWDVDKLIPGRYTLYAAPYAETQRYFSGKITVDGTDYNIYYNESHAPNTRIAIAQIYKTRTGAISVVIGTPQVTVAIRDVIPNYSGHPDVLKCVESNGETISIDNPVSAVTGGTLTTTSRSAYYGSTIIWDENSMVPGTYTLSVGNSGSEQRYIEGEISVNGVAYPIWINDVDREGDITIATITRNAAGMMEVEVNHG